MAAVVEAVMLGEQITTVVVAVRRPQVAASIV